MFTLEQIRRAHSKVRSGADFPAYINELKSLGVSGYEHSVTDGSTQYRGAGNFMLASPPKYDVLKIAPVANIPELTSKLKEHQAGTTDYLRFCKLAADAGVRLWSVDLEKMSCTYYDNLNGPMLIEQIGKFS